MKQRIGAILAELRLLEKSKRGPWVTGSLPSTGSVRSVMRKRLLFQLLSMC